MACHNGDMPLKAESASPHLNADLVDLNDVADDAKPRLKVSLRKFASMRCWSDMPRNVLWTSVTWS